MGFIHANAWKSAYEGIIPSDFLNRFTPERRSAVFQKVIPTRPEEYYISYLHSIPAGMLIVGMSSDTDVAPNTGEIMAIYLLKEFWGKGYGKLLMDFGVSRLHEIARTPIILWVLGKNKQARKFYNKYGITADGTRRSIDSGKPFTEMRYRLT